MSATHEQEPSLIEYPCRFPIKVMGANTSDFVAAVTAMAQAVDPGFGAEHLEQRPSRAGNYLGLTVQVWVHNREQLDGLYRAFTGHPLVKYVL
jgi:uncharacterized protein